LADWDGTSFPISPFLLENSIENIALVVSHVIHFRRLKWFNRRLNLFEKSRKSAFHRMVIRKRAIRHARRQSPLAAAQHPSRPIFLTPLSAHDAIVKIRHGCAQIH
jgi:hypothetical protein